MEVLINGTPSSFFQISRGLQQGCPLSPVLFLLIIEGLSKMIDAVKKYGKIDGLKIYRTLMLTHLIFVDDVLLFGAGKHTSWEEFHKILSTLWCVL